MPSAPVSGSIATTMPELPGESAEPPVRGAAARAMAAEGDPEMPVAGLLVLAGGAPGLPPVIESSALGVAASATRLGPCTATGRITSATIPAPATSTTEPCKMRLRLERCPMDCALEVMVRRAATAGLEREHGTCHRAGASAMAAAPRSVRKSPHVARALPSHRAPLVQRAHRHAFASPDRGL